MTNLSTILNNKPCPCGSQHTYSKCCKPWHAGEQYLQAPTAEALMRSRYSAYVIDHLPYLLDTWHPSTRPEQISPNPTGIKWLGLTIRSYHNQSDTQATVEFVARSRLQGRATRMHEKSIFLRENGQWFYVDGIFIE